MIEIAHLTYKYSLNQNPVINDINLTIKPGEYVTVIGPNGCGKTTLIRHLNALLLPSGGEVLVDGLCTNKSNNVREIRRLVGMIFQNPDNQIVGMSVEEDVAFGPGNLGLPPAEQKKRVGQALAAVGLTGFEARPPYTLSGGQKQLLALAGLLAMDPKVIVLDEPTASLDASGKKLVHDVVQKLHRQGITIIHVTQDMEEAAKAERILVLNRGNLVADGCPGDVLSRIEWLKSLGLVAPKITELMFRLNASGLGVDTRIIDINDACREISSLFHVHQPLPTDIS